MGGGGEDAYFEGNEGVAFDKHIYIGTLPIFNTAFGLIFSS
jgi:hypothetical protein